MTEYGKFLRLDADPVSSADVPCPTCGTPASGGCSHRVSTADLIDEARKRTDSAYEWFGPAGRSKAHIPGDVDLIDRLADALEAATKDAESWHDAAFIGMSHEAAVREQLVSRVVSTVAELDALPVDTVIKAASGAVLHRQRAELWTPCDDTADQFYTAGVVECFRAPYTVLWVGGTE